MKTQAEAILQFYRELNPRFEAGNDIEIMNPFQNEASWKFAELFYRKFYNDAGKRIFIFGINPGRFGGGITGIPFTDPVRLETACGIPNEFRKLPELSSIFIYEVIEEYGGTEKFYKDFFITALSPLGYTKNGINLNYYDDMQLLLQSQPFILECINKQIASILASNTCFCLGEGTNYKIFSRLNEQYHFFREIIPLPHPRWVMQYRRKRIKEFARHYVEKLSSIELF